VKNIVILLALSLVATSVIYPMEPAQMAPKKRLLSKWLESSKDHSVNEQAVAGREDQNCSVQNNFNIKNMSVIVCGTVIKLCRNRDVLDDFCNAPRSSSDSDDSKDADYGDPVSAAKKARHLGRAYDGKGSIKTEDGIELENEKKPRVVGNHTCGSCIMSGIFAKSKVIFDSRVDLNEHNKQFGHPKEFSLLCTIDQKKFATRSGLLCHLRESHVDWQA
jgi:hypothetical protein